LPVALAEGAHQAGLVLDPERTHASEPRSEQLPDGERLLITIFDLITPVAVRLALRGSS
jgi:hypothetical protein